MAQSPAVVIGRMAAERLGDPPRQLVGAMMAAQQRHDGAAVLGNGETGGSSRLSSSSGARERITMPAAQRPTIGRPVGEQRRRCGSSLVKLTARAGTRGASRGSRAPMALPHATRASARPRRPRMMTAGFTTCSPPADEDHREIGRAHRLHSRSGSDALRRQASPARHSAPVGQPQLAPARAGFSRCRPTLMMAAASASPRRARSSASGSGAGNHLKKIVARARAARRRRRRRP